MSLFWDEVSFPGGSQFALAAADVRSRRVLAIFFPDSWNVGDLNVLSLAEPPENLISRADVVNEAGSDIVLSAVDPETLRAIDPNTLEGLDYLHASSDVAQGIPAGFAVIPNTTNFSVGAPVTFTVTAADDGEGPFTANVSLSANYADVDALVAALNTKAPDVTWTNNAGAVTAEFSGFLGAYVDVTSIVDASDKMNFSSISAFAFPGYATDMTLTLMTEPRT